MSQEIAGLAIADFAEPIRVALAGYVELSEGTVGFDFDKASGLERTLSKPNSARSVSPLLFRGQDIGGLTIIAFNTGDATGDQNTYQVADLDMNPYPAVPGLVPRSKAAAHSEVHLTLASFAVDSAAAEPKLFAGALRLLGLDGVKLVQLGQLGQSEQRFKDVMNGTAQAYPTTTFTVGHRSLHKPHDYLGPRFGDPHVVLNPEQVVQVCGFFALSKEAMAKHGKVFRDLVAMPYKK